jgi:hypothetical protein
MILLQLGRRAEAREQFAEAVRLNPGFTRAREQLQALNPSPDSSAAPK